MPGLGLPRRAGGFCLAVALLGAMPAGAAAEIVLSDNLSAPSGGTVAAAGDTWLAASFGTGAPGLELSSVTLLLRGPSAGGQAALDLYADGGFEPGSLVATLAAPAGIPTSLGEVTFDAGGLALDANAIYWVVLRAPAGAFDWAWTASNAGSGPGFQVAWSQSDDAGATWFTTANFPFQMRVTAVPEPSSLLLLGAGATGLLFRRLRRPARRRVPAGRP